MRILVTGGTGLVGRSIQEVVRNDSSYDDDTFVFLSSKDGDLRDRQQVLRIFKKYEPTHIIHLAANCGGLFKNMHKKLTIFEDNLQLNLNVLTVAHECGVKQLMACLSTCIFPDDCEYPITKNQLHQGEPHPSNDAYAYTKRILEIHCRLYREQLNYHYICITPTNLYGKYDHFDMEDGHVIPALIKKCVAAKMENIPLVVCGTGKPLRQFLYAEDLAKIILRLLKLKQESVMSNLVIAPRNEITIETIAKIICKKLDHRYVLDTSQSDGQFRKTVCVDELYELFPNFEWTCIEDGIHETIDWFIVNQSNPT